jgi:hypothetical protein
VLGRGDASLPAGVEDEVVLALEAVFFRTNFASRDQDGDPIALAVPGEVAGVADLTALGGLVLAVLDSVQLGRDDAFGRVGEDVGRLTLDAVAELVNEEAIGLFNLGALTPLKFVEGGGVADFTL